jgi:hypothetical protein
LANVVVEVRGAVQNGGEAVGCLGQALRGIGQGPIGFGLVFDSGNHHGDGVVESAKNLCFGRATCLREFEIAIANVAGGGDSGSDVVAEVAREMKDQVASAVAIGKRIHPELFVGKWVDPLMKAGGVRLEFLDKGCGNGLAEFAHGYASCGRVWFFLIDDTLLREEDMLGAENILKGIAVGSNDVGEWADEGV